MQTIKSLSIPSRLLDPSADTDDDFCVPDDDDYLPDDDVYYDY